jgi:RNA polymerase sigma-70 factor (ECF subfamily)
MTAPLDAHSTTFAEHRPFLLSVAYRMLGTASEAEDIVQDCYLRWREVPLEEIKTPKSYLARAVTHLCINHLQSARVRREQYVGPWLPEPLLTAEAEDPVELSESLTMAFLVLLESLSPVERAVFLLSEVFDQDITEIAESVGKTPVNCRQILHRAREAVAARRPRFEARKEDVAPLLQSFTQAIYSGDVQRLTALLHPEAVLMTDGGGKVQAALNPIFSADKVARFFIGVAKKTALSDFEVRLTEVNRQPGMLLLRNGAVESTMVFHLENGKISRIFVTSNPDKLRTVATASSALPS